MHAIGTRKHHDLTINITLDESCPSPLNDHESEFRLVGWHDKYVNPTPQWTSPETVMEYCRETGAHALKVYLFDHGSNVYRLGETNPFDHQQPHGAWDSGWFGFLVIEAEELAALGYTEITPEAHAALIKHFAPELEEYTAWANGEVYAYTTQNAQGQTVDSCGGFFDEEQCMTEALTAADCLFAAQPAPAPPQEKRA